MKPTDSLKRPRNKTTSGNRGNRSRSSSRRRATVYDAVAGRVSHRGFIKRQSTTSKTSAKRPLRPDEVLFKRRNAPTRYEETDYYFAHANLPEGQKLPSGDLLSALHTYIAEYYAKTKKKRKQKMAKCMNGTALIALGILMEEMAREVIGETGDLAFLEGDEEGSEVSIPGMPRGPGS